MIDETTSVQMESEASKIIKAIKEHVPEIPKPTEGQKEEAIRRLRALTELLQAKPKPILQQLTEIDVPYQVTQQENGDDFITVRMKDIERADADLASRGTLYEQMYGRETE